MNRYKNKLQHCILYKNNTAFEIESNDRKAYE